MNVYHNLHEIKMIFRDFYSGPSCGTWVSCPILWNHKLFSFSGSWLQLTLLIPISRFQSCLRHHILLSKINLCNWSRFEEEDGKLRVENTHSHMFESTDLCSHSHHLPELPQTAHLISWYLTDRRQSTNICTIH
jgi:hypothetical protein